MRKILFFLLLAGGILFSANGCKDNNEKQNTDAANVSKDASAGGGAAGEYPPGSMTFWGTGQPQFQKMYYDTYMARTAPDISVEVETIKTMSDGQQKIAMYALSGDLASMPELIFLDSVGIIQLSSSGLLIDNTAFYTPLAGEFIDDAASNATVKGKVYALPGDVRPQVLFYNDEIFKKYNIDPAMMSTFDGYLEAGRLLKQRSNGQVFLSYVDPGSYTWRYYGRRGLMPQARARIWDDQGNVIIGSDPGTKLALGLFDKLYSEGLLYKTTMMQPPIYEATDEGKIATFYIGAFWDEFLRKNLTATAGKWRVLKAPVFPQIGTGGAPVANAWCILDKKPNKYAGLVQKLWYDFQTNIKERNAWTVEMEKINGAYSNPISRKLLADPFWQEPSEFYGGQSFRKAEGDGLANPSPNMAVTASDTEADAIISVEIEKYVAGEQTMVQAIANMDRELKLKIGKAAMP